MKKSIQRYFATILIISLFLTSSISATLISNRLLELKKQDLLYTLKLIDYAIDDQIPFSKQINDLNKASYDDSTRISIIDKQGKVLADSYNEFVSQNHLDREEIQEALKSQSGSSSRKSETTNENTLYVAYYNQKYIIRISVPYNGIRDQIPLLIPAFSISVILSFIVAYALSLKLTDNISRPIVEISNSLDHMSEDFRFDLKQYDYDEFNRIVDTIRNLSHKLRKTIREVNLEKYKVDEILKQMNEGFILLDEKYKLLIINEQAKTLLGDMNLYESIFDYLYYPSIIKALENNIQKQIIELNMNERIYACYITRVDIGVTLLFVDITESKKAERMRSEFFSNVSHELKTPMTSIRGYSDLLAEGLIQDENQKNIMLKKIQTEVNNMSTLINDILALSRIENTQIHEEMLPMMMKSVVEEVLESYEVEITKHHLTIHKDFDNISYIGNHQQVYTLLNNLIGNAIKYNKENGEVDISIESYKEAIKITIKDTGIGIPLADQARVFERFYRVDKGRSRQRGGTGLGLAIVKHIVSRYKGTIQLKSRINEGTQIDIILPNQQLSVNEGDENE